MVSFDFASPLCIKSWLAIAISRLIWRLIWQRTIWINLDTLSHLICRLINDRELVELIWILKAKEKVCYCLQSVRWASLNSVGAFFRFTILNCTKTGFCTQACVCLTPSVFGKSKHLTRRKLQKTTLQISISAADLWMSCLAGKGTSHYQIDITQSVLLIQQLYKF